MSSLIVSFPENYRTQIENELRMPGSFKQRIACISKRHTIPTSVRPGFLETLCRFFEWYGAYRRWVRSRLTVDIISEEHQIVTWKGSKMVLPRTFPLDRLASIVVELEAASNPHFFFHPNLHPRPGRWVIDVGACEGLFTLLSQEHWPRCPVLAVEPGPQMCLALKRTFDLNKQAAPIVLENCLLGSVSGEAGFVEDTADPARSRITAPTESEGDHAIQIKVSTIDALFADPSKKIGLIKMDAEGAELEILKGAEKTIKRDRPAMALTTYHNLEDAENIYAWLQDLGLDYTITVRGITCMDSLKPRPIMLFAFPRIC